jgi:prevent-host-death family protein
MKTVRIADLKARLSEHLRAVRRGHSLVVTDRDTPIARLVPYRSDGDLLSVREPAGTHSSLQEVPLPKAVRLGVHVVELLLEERRLER